MEKEEQKTRAEDTTVETATPATPADTGTAAAQEDNASVGLNAETQKLAEEIDQEFSADLLEEERIVEALLFTMGRSVGLDEIATALNAGKKIAQDAVEPFVHLARFFRIFRRQTAARRDNAAFLKLHIGVCSAKSELIVKAQPTDAGGLNSAHFFISSFP